jgi:hypothetical protein
MVENLKNLQIQELLEFLKFLVPFATFALGVWATPLIEARKEKAKAKSLRKNLILELEDELNELPKRLIKMASTLKSLIRLKEGAPEIGGLSKYVPRSTSSYFLKSATETSFGLFNKDQRYAIKSLFGQISALDDYVQAIKSTKISDETLDEAINNCKRYLYTGSCMLNTMRVIASKPKADPAGEDRKIIKAIFLELDIELSVDDLRRVSTTRFEKAG